MIPGGTIAVLLSALSSIPWAEADAVDVPGSGAVDLTPFACIDVTRSSVIDRVCYDAAKRLVIIQDRSIYRQYCNVPPDTLEALLNAPSMGQFYRAKISSSAEADRYVCADQPRATSVRSAAGRNGD